MKTYTDFVGLIAESLKNNWDLDALTDYQGVTLQYKDVARKIEKLHILFENAGVERGDRIALCGRNSANWATAFMAILSYGAVAVPILHEFKSSQVHDIVNHSEAKILFAGDVVWPELDANAMPHLEGVVSIPDYSLLVSRTERLTEARERLNELFGKKYPKFFRKELINYPNHPAADDLALINYTSGTTSNSKGVMIPYRAIWSNYEFAIEVLGKQVKRGDSVISMLPMAHMYGMSFEFIFEFLHGCHIYYLTRIPSPKIVMQAFADIKPSIIISVPLIIEKIIKKNVLPKLQTPSMKVLLKLPLISNRIFDKIRERLVETFGGRFYEIIVGGAAFNSEVENLLKRIGFPYTVGYGATECAPIITYEDWHHFRQGSCGKAVPRMEVRIDSPDPERVAGEILARGANTMLGYFKNEEATRATLDAEGWYHTGDLGTMSADGHVFIRGRIKNMLLGSNGQNVYPEEIEDKLNSMAYVNESLIVQKGDKLIGLVHPDYDEAKAMDFNDDDLMSIMEQNRLKLNEQLPPFCKISELRLHEDEFVKTPKKSIKRYLYKDV